MKDYKISIKENIKKTSTRYILGNIEIFIRGLESDLLFFKNLTSENNNFINWISYTYKNNTLKKVSINIAPEKLNDISADILVDSVHQSSAQLHYQQTQDLSFF